MTDPRTLAIQAEVDAACRRITTTWLTGKELGIYFGARSQSASRWLTGHGWTKSNCFFWTPPDGNKTGTVIFAHPSLSPEVVQARVDLTRLRGKTGNLLRAWHEWPIFEPDHLALACRRAVLANRAFMERRTA